LRIGLLSADRSPQLVGQDESRLVLNLQGLTELKDRDAIQSVHKMAIAAKYSRIGSSRVAKMLGLVTLNCWHCLLWLPSFVQEVSDLLNE
jgi:hypothetical protein